MPKSYGKENQLRHDGDAEVVQKENQLRHDGDAEVVQKVEQVQAQPTSAFH